MNQIDKAAHFLKIGYSLEELPEVLNTQEYHPNEIPSSLPYEIVNSNVACDFGGRTSLDYSYFAEITLTIENNETVYVQGAWYANGDTIFGTAKKSIFKDEDGQATRDDVLEQYRTLFDASNGVFGPYYLLLDQITDAKAVEVLKQSDDTRYIGARFYTDNEHTKGFIEAFNHGQPELSEYLQVTKENDTYHFSASHRSVFLRKELGALYEMIYGEEDAQEYVSVDSVEQLPEEFHYFKSSFRQMKRNLSEYLKRNGWDISQEELEDGVRAIRIVELKIKVFAELENRHCAELTIETEDGQILYVDVFDLPDHTPCWSVARKSIFDGMNHQDEAEAAGSIIESTEDWQESKQSSFSRYYHKLEQVAKATFRSSKTELYWQEGTEDYHDLNSLL